MRNLPILIGACAAFILSTSASGQNLTFFPETARKVATSSTAIDAAGGLHMAFTEYVPAAEKPQAIYTYCSAGEGCGSADQWRRAAIGTGVAEVQLAVNAAGQPRMLLRVFSERNGFEREYHYAECNADCGNAASWKVTPVTGTYGTSIMDVHDNDSPQRYFALDPQGRPRFVHIDRNYLREPDHHGTFYVFCDADCTNADNWRETLIADVTPYDYETLRYPSLTFTRNGAPRVLGVLYTLSAKKEQDGLYYLSCENGCDRREGWQRVYLVPRGQGTNPSWDLELDSHDRPRVAFYIGELADGGGENLFYLWCNENCTSAANWFYNNPGLGQGHGRHPDLELTVNDQPRIAFLYGNTAGLGLLWCDSDCEADEAPWKGGIVETRETLEEQYPVPRPTTCDAALWSALTPVLSIDRQGRLFAGYDARYDTRCWIEDPTRKDPPSYRFHQLWHTVRGVFIPSLGE